MKKIKITGRPLNGFRAILDEHRDAGMEILTRNARSMPMDLRRDLQLEPENFAICGFMGRGNGTILEVADYNVSAAITPDFARRKMIYVDPEVFNPSTGHRSRFLDHDIPMLRRRIECDGMSEHTARKLNNNCVRYQPAPHLSPDQISDELVSLTIILRHNALHYAPHAGYTPLPNAVLREYICPVEGNGSHLAPLFEEYPVEWDWLHDAPKGRTIRVKGRTANHEFVGRYARPTRNGGQVVLG